MTFSAADHGYMARAIQLAERGLYTTDPNPRVGCVLVNDGVIVGEGWHEKAGEPHAEVFALREAGDRAKGATAYVTLEPCCHHGKTPPCSDALIQAGISRVVAAMVDPNPSVAGNGLQQLQQAGVETSFGLLEAQARALNPGFIRRMQSGRPFVRCKLAMSLDGRTAMASGESKWITSPAAREDVQKLRARSSAIMTGAGTVLADDPRMTVRLDGVMTQPLRVVVDTHLSMMPDARMLKEAGETLVFTCTDEIAVIESLQQAGARVEQLNGCHPDVDLARVLDRLGELGINEVLLETGATLSGAMLSQGLIDEIIVYLAPVLMGNSARGLFNLPGLENMQDRIQLEIRDIRAVGSDWRITATVKK